MREKTKPSVVTQGLYGLFQRITIICVVVQLLRQAQYFFKFYLCLKSLK